MYYNMRVHMYMYTRHVYTYNIIIKYIIIRAYVDICMLTYTDDVVMASRK